MFCKKCHKISIHSSHTGRDQVQGIVHPRRQNFNPLFPYGKRPICHNPPHTGSEFQSTLPIREETGYKGNGGKQLTISIHSSHTGRDVHLRLGGGDAEHFNPLFPYGKRHDPELADALPGIFQSTLPIREETTRGKAGWSARTISIHSSHTGRDLMPETVSAMVTPISIHSSHTGRDLIVVMVMVVFQISILSSHTGRDAAGVECAQRPLWISIHSSHTGRDPCRPGSLQAAGDFNPLFPYGKRLGFRLAYLSGKDFNPLFPYGKRPRRPSGYFQAPRFQSTLPIREETLRRHSSVQRLAISIHSSHTGRDTTAIRS